MGLESLCDLFIAIAAYALFAAGETHVYYEFWDKHRVNDPARFASPNLIFQHCFFGMSGTIPASIFLHDVP
jgi:hypothetical protein